MSNEIERERTELGLHSSADAAHAPFSPDLIDPFPDAGNDTVVVNYPLATNPETLDGAAGTDTLTVNWGSDPNAVTFSSQAGATANGGIDGALTDTGGENVTFTSFEVFNLTLGGGNDVIAVAGNLAGSTFHAGAGTDTLNLETTSVTLSNFVASTDSIEDVSLSVYGATVNATAASDVINFTGVTNTSGVAFVIQGQGGADALSGSEGVETINGGAGNDTIAGNGGADVLDGNSGTNSLDGGTGADTLIGENGHDTLFGNADNDVIYADQGFYASGGSTVGTGGVYAVDGGAGDDLIVITGDLTGSTFQGNTGTDTLNFENQNITLSNFVASTDSIEDVSLSVYGVTVNATAASDVINFTGVTNTSGVAFVIQGQGGADALSGSEGVETINGGAGNDTIAGNGGADVLDGNSGTNSLDGGTGADTLIGENGHDTLFGNADNDVIYADQGFYASGGTTVGTGGVYAVDGGAGDDLIVITGDLTGSTFQGNAGTDTLNFENQNITLSNFVASTDSIEDVSLSVYGVTVNATAASDVINFTGVTNTSGVAFVIQGQGGADALSGSEGVETINGGAGNDTIAGNGGADVLDGNSGTNSLDGGTGADTLIGENGHDTLFGNADNDVIYADQGFYASGGSTVGTGGVYAVDGGAGDDLIVITGDLTGSTFQGNAGTDTLNFENQNITLSNFVASTDSIEDVSVSVYGVTVNATAASDTIDFSGTTNTSGVGFEIDGQAGNDSLFGSTSNDTILGGDGNDTLGGNGGDDLIDGQGGNNTASYANASGGVTVDLNLQGAGQNTTSDGNDNLNNIQNLIGSGLADALVGDTANNRLSGGAGNDTLTGNAGADTLDGGAGSDSMVGGVGNDTYVVDSASDVVVEASGAGSGTDTVLASISYTLGANVENLTLTGATSLVGTGNSLANVLTANNAGDTLDGGTGVDTLVGGQGNDTFIVDNTLDVVTEAAGAGTDLVKASVNYTLSANVENLTMTGAASLTGTGNTANNVITANDAGDSLSGGTGNDTLIGGAGDDTLNAGSGVDSMAGGGGNDLYIVANSADVVTEAANAGIDTVQSNVTYTLSANVENLILTGATAINGTGNSLDNVITGSNGANTLDGGAGNDTLHGSGGGDSLIGGLGGDLLDGGAGADTMVGGTGFDTYIVDNVGDVVVESAGGGTDQVQSSITYTLTANVENLQLTGHDVIDGTGNSGNNTVRGNTQNNVLNGEAGDDTINGGKGHDTVTYFDAASGVTVSLGVATGQATGGSGTDTLASIENLTGSGFADHLTGSAKANHIDGGAGADTITGGRGADNLTGGGDNDTFVYNSIIESTNKISDTITDLTNTDVIDLHAIDANTTVAGDQAFVIVSAFDHHAGELTLSYNSTTNQTSVLGDVNGDGKADFRILLTGDHHDFNGFVL